MHPASQVASMPLRDAGDEVRRPRQGNRGREAIDDRDDLALEAKGT